MAKREAPDWSARWAGGPGRWGADLGSRGANPLAVVGLVFGVLACLLSFTIVAGVVFGVLGLGFAALGRSRSRAGRAGHPRLALAAVATAAAGLLLTVVVLVSFLTGTSFHRYQACRHAAKTLPELNACAHLLHYF